MELHDVDHTTFFFLTNVEMQKHDMLKLVSEVKWPESSH